MKPPGGAAEGILPDTTRLHPETRLGTVELTIPDLRRSLDFYKDVIGLSLLRREGEAALFGVEDGGGPFLSLFERPGARPKPRRTTGLYHFAILLPSRPHLARSLKRLIEVRYPLQGASDHLVSEALYLADPDGNGIEIYADRPRRDWPRMNGLLQMATEPLDVDSLLRQVEGDRSPWQGLPASTRIGHVHLHVSDLRAAEAFYAEVLGFDPVLRLGGSASFLSAGGYHHHVGLNTWAGVGAPPPPPEAVGLRAFTILLHDPADLERVSARVQTAGVAMERGDGTLFLRDPSANGIALAIDRMQEVKH